MSGSKQSEQTPRIQDEQAQQRIDELEMRVAFMEDTIDALNQQLADLSLEFSLAKQAMQMMNKRLEQMQPGSGVVKDFAEETPPPHY